MAQILQFDTSPIGHAWYGLLTTRKIQARLLEMLGNEDFQQVDSLLVTGDVNQEIADSVGGVRRAIQRSLGTIRGWPKVLMI